MKLGLFDDYRLGVIVDGGIVDATDALPWPHGPDPVTAGWWRRLCRHFPEVRGKLDEKAKQANTLPLEEVHLRAPALNPSKIVATASNYPDHITEMHDVLDADALPPLDEVIARLLGALEHLGATRNVIKVAVQAWAEALRTPAFAEKFAELVGGVRRLLTRLVEAYQERGLMTREVPAEHVARVLVGLLPGFAVQHAILGDVDTTMFRDGLRALVTSTHSDGAASDRDAT